MLTWMLLAQWAVMVAGRSPSCRLPAVKASSASGISLDAWPWLTRKAARARLMWQLYEDDVLMAWSSVESVGRGVGCELLMTTATLQAAGGCSLSR